MATEVKTENEALIESMVLEAEKVAEPGEVTPGGVIHKGDDDVPSPMVMSKITSAGYATIYNTLTGESSKMNLNMLRRKLRLKRADGSPVFSTNPPKVLPTRGEYKCQLHPDDPNRKHYDGQGFAVCMKSNLNSPYQVRRHMEKKHKDEWKAIEQERTERERQEDRTLQRLLLSKATEEKAPLYVSDKLPKTRKVKAKKTK